MAIITLFHGSPYESVTPEYGLGNDKHDYGRGFYLTANVELAKEWAVCRPDESTPVRTGHEWVAHPGFSGT